MENKFQTPPHTPHTYQFKIDHINIKTKPIKLPEENIRELSSWLRSRQRFPTGHRMQKPQNKKKKAKLDEQESHRRVETLQNTSTAKDHYLRYIKKF